MKSLRKQRIAVSHMMSLKFKLLSYLRRRELSCWLKRWLISGNLAIWTVLVLEKKYYYNAFVAQFSDRCFGWLPAAMPISLAWRLHTNLYKFGGKVSPRILHKKNCCDLNLGESLCIFTLNSFFSQILDFLKGFDFYFVPFWMARQWKPAIIMHYDLI